MKKLGVIKNEVAYELFGTSFPLAIYEGLHAINIMQLINEVAKRYAEESLIEAAEKSTMIVERNNKVIANKNIAWITVKKSGLQNTLQGVTHILLKRRH